MQQEWWKQVPPLILDREGRWYDRGVRVTNPRLAEFLLANLTRGEDGRYLVDIGRDKRYVEVEDAAYRVLGVEVTGTANAPEYLLLRLNDGSLEPFDPATFWIGPDGSPYCLVRTGLHKARFTTESYRQLSAFITEEGDAGHYFLQIGSQPIPVPILPS